MTSPAHDRDHLTRLCSLDDPTRRRVYDHVAAHDDALSRDAVAGALGLERATAAYHLDKLVEQGLLEASFARPPGRGGPGAGRPAKHYRRVEEELHVSLPPRDYRLVAEILVRAAADDPSGAVRRALDATATAVGRELADDLERTAATEDAEDAEGELVAFLAARGFAPYRDGDRVRLRNCPFHPLAREHTELICGMNLGVLAAAAETVAPAWEARLEPADGRCCVAFGPGDGRSSDERDDAQAAARPSPAAR